MLRLEPLESRLTPDVSVSLSSGLLAVLGDARPNVVQVSQDADQILVAVDQQPVQQFPAAAVQRVVIDGGVGDDVLTQLVGALPTVLVGGEGQDNLWTFGSDVLLGGPGEDTLYSIVGASYLDGGPGNDRVIGNGTSVLVPDAGDRPPVLFRQRTFPVVLDVGVLYFQGTDGPDRLSIQPISDRLMLVTYNGTTFQVDPRIVTQLAGVLGGGDDVVLMPLAIDAVFYGAAGNDLLTGGPGADLLKGGGGNDVILGWGGNDDLTGDGGADVVVGGDGRDLIRVDASDVFFADAADIVVLLAQRRQS